MPAHLYIDGYNFYYGVTNHFRRERDLRGYSLSGLCWCDFRALVERHFLHPGETLGPIRYFTAEVTAETAANNHEAFNQHLWLDALQTIPGLETIYGFHQKPEAKKEREEKQTDANVVVELLLDAMTLSKKPTRIFLLSGDTDYMPAILALEERLPVRCPVTVLLPPSANPTNYAKRFRDTQQVLHRRKPSSTHGFPLDIRQLSEDILANSLLSYAVPSPKGCPHYWRLPEKYLTERLTNPGYYPGRRSLHA